MKYYAGIGSRETPAEIMSKMTEIASLLEKEGYILRSGGASGADVAFEQGVLDRRNMNIYLPKAIFNSRRHSPPSYIFIEYKSDDWFIAYESLKFHPRGFNMSPSTQLMMIRNFFQVHGISGERDSDFVVCWTPDSANGTSIKTSYDTGGTGQALRLAAHQDVPVYNLCDSRYNDLAAEEIVTQILTNLSANVNPNKFTTETWSLFDEDTVL